VSGIHSTLSESETKKHGTWSCKHKEKNGRKDFVIKFDVSTTEWYRAKQISREKQAETDKQLNPPGHCDTERYDQLLAEKVEKVTLRWKDCASRLQAPLPAPEVFASAPIHFRNRAEFRVWHEGKRHYLSMFRDQKAVEVTKFDFGSRVMNVLMPLINQAINDSQKLGTRLGYVYFLTTLRGDVMITFIYTAQLDDQWTAEATELHQVLKNAAVAADRSSAPSGQQEEITVQIIGRAKKQRLLIPEGATGIVTEKFDVGGRSLLYKQQEESFTQPNAGMCNNMLSWAHAATASFSETESDLLELYCGCGNFCIALARNFRKVLATEISAPSVVLAKLNIEMNGVGGLVKVARLSSEEYAEAHGRVRTFERLKREDIDLDNYR
jgi:tRNA (uracil-5-)-methyltransferase